MGVDTLELLNKNASVCSLNTKMKVLILLITTFATCVALSHAGSSSMLLILILQVDEIVVLGRRHKHAKYAERK